MKKLIKTFIMTICLIIPTMSCLTAFGVTHNGTLSVEAENASPVESNAREQAAYLDVQDMIDALPDVEEIKKMGNSDKQKAYADMQAASTAYNQLSEAEKESIRYYVKLSNAEAYFRLNPLPSGEVSYGFLMNQTLVTSQNLSGDGWSYDPDTQTLTLGDENELDVGFSKVPDNTDTYWKKHDKYVEGKNVNLSTHEFELFYASVIQPVVQARDANTNTCTFSPDRPSKLKIDVKGLVIFGKNEWSNRWGQYTSSCKKYFEMGGILWDGDLEITGTGTLKIFATTYAIYVDGTANIHDIELETLAYNNAISFTGDLNVTSSTLKASSTSLGSIYFDLKLKGEYDNVSVSDSKHVIHGNYSFNIKNSTVTVDAVWNRTYTLGETVFHYAHCVSGVCCDNVNVENSSLNVTAHIEEGWASSKEESEIMGIWANLHLYDDAFVNVNSYVGEYFITNSHLLGSTALYGLRGKSYGHGNAVLVVATEPYLGSARQAIKDFCFNPVTQKWAVGYIQTEGDVQYTFAPPSSPRGNIECRLIVEYRKNDTIYLRDQDGKKQAAWNMDFSNCVDLDSNVINEADFASQVEGRACNVRVVSGNFTVLAKPNSEAKRFYETLGGSLTVQLKDGNYGDVHVFTAPSSSVTIQSKGVIENLTVKPHVSIDHKNYYVETGSLTINGGTVKNCEIDKAYEGNVSFNGGNVKVDISNIEYYRQYFKEYYNTIIYDFSDVQGTVDFANDGMSVNNGYNVNGSQLIDGKYYFYVKKTGTEDLEDFVNNVYVEPSTGYNHYMLPELAASSDGITTYTFKRVPENFDFTLNNQRKYIYVSVGDKDVTLDAGYVEAYVFNRDINYGLKTVLKGSKTQTLPEGYFAKWFYVDEKTGETIQLVAEGQSLLYTVNEVVLDDEFRTYKCEIYRKDRLYHVLVDTFVVKPRIMVMSVSPRAYDVYVKTGNTVTLKLTIDENCYNNWRQDLVVAWQARKNADSEWIDLTDSTKSNPTYNLKITDEEMISWEYRAVVYQLIRPLDEQAAPEYHSNSIFFYKRETKFKGKLENISGKNGEYYGTSVDIEDGYLSSIDCYWERSQDGGKTWSKVIHDGNTFIIFALTLGTKPIGGGSSVNYTTSMSINVKLDSSLNGDILRAVIYDKSDGTYMYTNESLITLTDHVHEWSTTEIVAKEDADCEHNGTKAHWHCNSCGKDYAEDQETVLSDLTIESSGHDYGDVIVKEDASCVKSGFAAHYECSRCHKLFDENKLEKSESELVIAVAPNAHKLGESYAEVPATAETEGTKAHKDCELCGKHFDENGVEISDLTISKISNSNDKDIIPDDIPDIIPDDIPDENEDFSTGAIIGIAVGSSAAAGVGGFSIAWFAVKKKSFADLIGAIKKIFKRK